jgi:hypothetical protein
MKIEIEVKDRDGNDINIGDKVEIYDWGVRKTPMGIVEIIWDVDTGSVSCQPQIVDDPYDFWSKALPRSRKIMSENIQ